MRQVGGWNASFVFPNEIAEIGLNRKRMGMEAIYDMREETLERRQSLERWAAFIVACDEGESGMSCR